MRIVRRGLLAVLVLAGAVSRLGAHPHVFIDARIEIEMNGRECTGLWVEWVLDSVFSADLIGQFDENRDGRFSEAESENVRQDAFSNLRRYGYFLFIRQGNRRFSPEKVDSFRAIQRSGRVVYRFHVGLGGLGFAEDFAIAVFDTTFYCDARYLDPPAAVLAVSDASDRELPLVEVSRNKKYPVYYNPTGAPGDTRVYQTWEKGLQTAYPEEIRVYFPQ